MIDKKDIKKREKRFKEYLQRQKDKRKSTKGYAEYRVKCEARRDAWCSTHANCFRFYEGETEEHVRAKFERFLHWRSMECTVYTELILKNGKRPDLIICQNNGDIFIEEIMESESDESIELKEKSYPFPIRLVKANQKNK